jgi:hypothetical protein
LLQLTDPSSGRYCRRYRLGSSARAGSNTDATTVDLSGYHPRGGQPSLKPALVSHRYIYDGSLMNGVIRTMQ